MRSHPVMAAVATEVATVPRNITVRRSKTQSSPTWLRADYGCPVIGRTSSQTFSIFFCFFFDVEQSGIEK